MLNFLENAITKQDELKLQMLKLDNLKSDLNEKDKELSELKRELEDSKKSIKDVSIGTNYTYLK